MGASSEPRQTLVNWLIMPRGCFGLQMDLGLRHVVLTISSPLKMLNL